MILRSGRALAGLRAVSGNPTQTYSAEAAGETSPEPWIFTLRLLTENRVLSYVDKKPPKPMDKPENEFITKKHFGPRSGSPRPILGAAMHDIGHTKAWLLAGALWLFFVPDLVCALTPGPHPFAGP